MNEIAFVNQNEYITLVYDGKRFETKFPYSSEVDSEKFIFNIIDVLIRFPDEFMPEYVNKESLDNIFDMARWITKNVPEEVFIRQYNKVFNIRKEGAKMSKSKLLPVLAFVFIAGEGAFLSVLVYKVHGAFSVLVALWTLVMLLIIWDVGMHDE